MKNLKDNQIVFVAEYGDQFIDVLATKRGKKNIKVTYENLNTGNKVDGRKLTSHDRILAKQYLS